MVPLTTAVLMLVHVLWEELFFRVFVLQHLIRNFDERFSICLQGVFFGLMHFFNMQVGNSLLYIFVQVFVAVGVGTWLGVFMLQTKSAFSCLLIHYLINISNELYGMENVQQSLNVIQVVIYLLLSVVCFFTAMSEVKDRR